MPTNERDRQLRDDKIRKEEGSIYNKKLPLLFNTKTMWDSLFLQKPTNLYLGKNFIQAITSSTMIITILKTRIIILHHKSIHTWNSPTSRISLWLMSKKLAEIYGATLTLGFPESSSAIDIISITHLASIPSQCPCKNYGPASSNMSSSMTTLRDQ